MSIAAQEIAERCLHEAASRGDCLALVDEVSSVHARFVGEQLTSSGHSQHRRLTLATLDDHALGVATRTGLDQPDALRATVAAARAHSSPLGHDGHLVGADVAAPCSDWSAPPSQLDADTLADVAANATVGPDGTPHGFAQQQVTTSYLATSTGLRLRYEDTRAVLDVSWMTDEPHGTGAWAGALGDTLAGFTSHRLRPITRRWQSTALRRGTLRPGRYDVLLTPSCMADLAHHLYDALGAEEALMSDGPFDPLCRDRLTALPLTLRSDPAHPALRCAPFVIARGADPRTSILDNGLALGPTQWIAEGNLNTLIHTRHTARQGDRRPTPLIDNLVLESETAVDDIEALIASTKRGLLVNSLWYLRPIDRQQLTLTGLTRDGVYLIEDGEVTAELPDFRFNESVIGLFRRITAVGHPEPALPREWAWVSTRMAMPAVRVADFGVVAVST